MMALSVVTLTLVFLHVPPALCSTASLQTPTSAATSTAASGHSPPLSVNSATASVHSSSMAPDSITALSHPSMPAATSDSITALSHPSMPAATSDLFTGSVTGRGSRLDLWQYLPLRWKDICDVDYDVDVDVNGTLLCNVTSTDQVIWRLADLRQALNDSVVTAQALQVSVRLECETGGTISLPYPMRAPGLTKLTVRNCHLLDKYADFNTSALGLGDGMTHLDMLDCVWLNDPLTLDLLLANVDAIQSDYDCGQDATWESFVYRNISDVNLQDGLLGADPCLLAPPQQLLQLNLTYPDDVALMIDDDAVFEQIKQLGQTVGGPLKLCAEYLESIRLYIAVPGPPVTDDVTTAATSRPMTSETTMDPNEALVDSAILLGRFKSSCVYEKLEVLDESQTPILHRKHFEFMVENSVFPSLRVLNYSYCGIDALPTELREWRTHLVGAPVEMIDLSGNLIDDVDHIPPYANRLPDVFTTINLQNNRISTISVDKFEEWALLPDSYIDVRDNPIDCSCDLKEVLEQLDNETRWAGLAMGRYKRDLSVMRCATPPRLSGRVIDRLVVSDLDCPVVESKEFLWLAVVGLGAALVLVVVVLLLAVRYRREVRILMYTRVHILLPCGVPRSPGEVPEKTYDAFVSYAHQDSDWVLGSLLKRLEEPGQSRARRASKLCIHQRDFVVGKPIIDNIIDSIAASRHTIVVLSNSFVRSDWAMTELQQAYQQSLEERKRHLVLVVLEDVANKDMTPLLRRCCQTFTYLHVKDTFFWDRLQYSIQVGVENTNKAKTRQNERSTTTTNTTTNVDTVDYPDKVSGEGSQFCQTAVFTSCMRTTSMDSDVTTVTTLSQDDVVIDDVRVDMTHM